jgi:hypothetical protein
MDFWLMFKRTTTYGRAGRHEAIASPAALSIVCGGSMNVRTSLFVYADLSELIIFKCDQVVLVLRSGS